MLVLISSSVYPSYNVKDKHDESAVLLCSYTVILYLCSVFMSFRIG